LGAIGSLVLGVLGNLLTPVSKNLGVRAFVSWRQFRGSIIAQRAAECEHWAANKFAMVIEYVRIISFMVIFFTVAMMMLTVILLDSAMSQQRVYLTYPAVLILACPIFILGMAFQYSSRLTLMYKLANTPKETIKKLLDQGQNLDGFSEALDRARASLAASGPG
jgi:hypothetical protein